SSSSSSAKGGGVNGSLKTKENEKDAGVPPHTKSDHDHSDTAKAAAPPQVSEEERRKILQSPEFERFFEKTTKVVERLLGQEELFCDPFVDYSGRQTTATDGYKTSLTYPLISLPLHFSHLLSIFN
ncbi:cytoplasmic dynein intermediate chain, partial [Cystoisospora suis]